MIGSTDLGCILLSALRIGLVHTAVIRWKDAGLCNVSLCLFELRPSTTISRIVPCAKITRLKPSEAEETRGNKRQQEARTAHTHTLKVLQRQHRFPHLAKRISRYPMARNGVNETISPHQCTLKIFQRC